MHLPDEDVLQHDDWVLAGVVNENFLEVGGAGGEDDLVRAHAPVLAHDGAVHQGLILNNQIFNQLNNPATKQSSNQYVFFGYSYTKKVLKKL